MASAPSSTPSSPGLTRITSLPVTATLPDSFAFDRGPCRLFAAPHLWRFTVYRTATLDSVCVASSG